MACEILAAVHDCTAEMHTITCEQSSPGPTADHAASNPSICGTTQRCASKQAWASLSESFMFDTTCTCECFKPGQSWSWTQIEPTAATRRHRPQTAASTKYQAGLLPQTPHPLNCCSLLLTELPRGRVSPLWLGRGWDVRCERRGQRSVRGCCCRRPGCSLSQCCSEWLTWEKMQALSPAACV